MITLQFANAQTQGERVPTTEITRLVTDVNTKLNGIYNERIKGHEDEQAHLRKAIYSANTELMVIRSLLAGNQMLLRSDYAKLQKPLAELTSAIQAVDQATGEADLQQTVCTVTTKAKAVKKLIQKIGQRNTATVRESSQRLTNKQSEQYLDYSHKRSDCSVTWRCNYQRSAHDDNA